MKNIISYFVVIAIALVIIIEGSPFFLDIKKTLGGLPGKHK